MKDEFRHKIDINNIKAIKSSYDISSFDNSDYIRITSIPFCEVKNENYMKKIIMEISKMKVHLVFYTFDKNISNIDLEQEKEIEFYKYLIHFLELRDKLIFLCDSKEDLNNEEINQFINKFNIDENDDIYTGGKIYSNSNKIFFINNEIIYDTNNNLGIQKEWEIINNKMKEIKEIIKSQEMKEIQKNEFFNILLSDNKNKVEDYFNKLRTHENKDKYYFLYFFGEIKFDKDRSDILINLINKMITMINVRHKWIKKDSNEIEFIDNKNYRYIIRPISKINFSNLKNIVFKNCELYDDNSILLNNLITTNLERLDLSFNKLNKLNLIFTEKIKNLKDLDLSHNNISDISHFADSKLISLINLDLSYNDIYDIECLGLKTNFNKLEVLNLSNNKISEIKALTENDKLIYLKKLYLNNNNISNVSCLSDSKFSNLLELDLSFNKIENIDFIELNMSLNSIEKIDLSNNQIIKLVKINLKSIKYLNLLNNHIIDGINDFTKTIANLYGKLILEKLKDNSIRFDYNENFTKFVNSLNDNTDIVQSLKVIAFTCINYLKIKGFDDNNIKFLSNNSLKDLKELDIKENSLTIISIFDNISFPNINKIIASENDFNENSLEH